MVWPLISWFPRIGGPVTGVAVSQARCHSTRELTCPCRPPRSARSAGRAWPRRTPGRRRRAPAPAPPDLDGCADQVGARLHRRTPRLQPQPARCRHARGGGLIDAVQLITRTVHRADRPLVRAGGAPAPLPRTVQLEDAGDGAGAWAVAVDCGSTATAQAPAPSPASSSWTVRETLAAGATSPNERSVGAVNRYG